MPHCLVVVMAPRIVLMNGEGDIVIRRSLVDSQESLNKEEVDHVDGSFSVTATDGYNFEVNIKNYLCQTLENLHMQNYLCSKPNVVEDERKNSIQAMVICEKGPSVDMVMAKLTHIGVGSLVGSVNVIGLETSKFYKAPINLDASEVDLEANHTAAKGTAGRESTNNEDAAKKKLFLEVASKIRVEQVVEIIENGAQFSFDYLCLLAVSSTIAGIGLATNNSVYIVASMLVSPIMGPVLALTFGSLIHDRKLTMLGLKHEFASLLICIGIGFIIGVISICIGTDGDWPTSEMRNRGVLNSLGIGFAIAIPSGIGVALSVLGNNNSSLVGVAISASLLPPAVNCGIAFAYSCLGFAVDSGALDDDDQPYSDPYSYFKLGGVSLCLTLINIGAIYVSALVMFWIKEVAPISTQTAFWQEDIKLSRDWNYSSRSHLHSTTTITSHDPRAPGSAEENCGETAPAATKLPLPPFTTTGSPNSSSPSPHVLELQTFQTNPILQEEFLRSSIGNKVMASEIPSLAITSLDTYPHSPCSAPGTPRRTSPRNNLLDILRQGSHDSTGSDGTTGEVSQYTADENGTLHNLEGQGISTPSSRHTIKRAQSTGATIKSSSSPTDSDFNTATPSSPAPPPSSRNPMPSSPPVKRHMRRGSKSARNLIGAMNAVGIEDDGGYGPPYDIDLDEIKHRLRVDAQLLHGASVSSSSGLGSKSKDI